MDWRTVLVQNYGFYLLISRAGFAVFYRRLHPGLKPRPLLHSVIKVQW